MQDGTEFFENITLSIVQGVKSKKYSRHLYLTAGPNRPRLSFT